jgi:hypothetical protein
MCKAAGWEAMKGTWATEKRSRWMGVAMKVDAREILSTLHD